MNCESKLIHVVSSVLTACVLMVQPSRVTAQTNISDHDIITVDSAARKKFLDKMDKEVSDIRTQETNDVRRLTKDEEEWAANVQRHFVAPKPWPELAHKQETLTFCAAILRTAIDLNEIELACGQLTNQPEAAAVLKNFSKAVTSNLNEFADMLADPEITTSVGSEGYRAELSKSRYNYIFTFGTTNKLPSAVRSFNKRLPDNSLVMGGDFYENGKLRSFNLQPKGRGRHGNSGLYFTEDGKLARYWIAPKEIAP